MALRFAKLDNRLVRKLGPGQKITEHGITVERLATGDIRYSINVMVDGARIHRVVGKASAGVTRGDAERLIEELRTDARHRRLNLPEGRKLSRSFGEVAEAYIIRMESSGGKDMKNKKRHLRQRLVPFLGSDRIDKITNFRLGQYRKHRTDDGASQATINREMSTLSHMLHHAASKDLQWLKKDDLPKIPKEKETRKKILLLTPSQQQRLLKAAAQDQNGVTWVFVMFGLNTTMRHGEIVPRRFDEVDFLNCCIWINKAKAGERQQPITPALRDALLRHREMSDDPNGWIFPAARKTCKTGHRPDMGDSFARAVKLAGLDPAMCTPHIMRHTAITALVKAKADIPTIQKISGHKTAAQVLHYVHVFGEHVHEALSALDQTVPEAIAPKLHAHQQAAAKRA